MRFILLAFLLLGNVSAWATDYKKITNVADIEVGKNYLIVYEDGTTAYVMGAVDKNYMGAVQTTIQDGVLTLLETANVITLGGDKVGYTLKTTLNGNYLYYGGSGTNLGTNATIDNKTKWTITFDNGFAKICNVNKTDRYVKNYLSNHTFRGYTATNGEWVTLYKEVGNATSITASDVEYAADIISGEIPYTINNPVEGTNFTVSTTATDWISDIEIAADKVTFKMLENEATESREGIITLKYGEGVTKEVKVTQLAAVAKRKVTIETPENGTLKMYRDGKEVVSGSLIPQGTELTAEPVADDGYKFRNWQAVDGSTHTYDKNFTYTVGEKDVTFKANFDKIVYNTITWSVNGVKTTETVEQEQTITFDNKPAGIPEGYVFTGWYGDEYFNTTTAPTYVTSATATADVTYYAVFAKSSGGSGAETTVELTNEQIKKASDDDKSQRTTYKERDINGWTGKYGLPLNNGTYSLLINRSTDSSKGAYNSHLATPECPAPIKSITIKTNNGTAVGRTVYLCSTNDVGAADVSSATYGSATLGEKNGSVTIPVVGETKQLYIYSSATFYIESIQLTYGENVTYSDFRTSITAPTTATITIAEACTDGEMYYGTYSNSKAFVVSNDIIVSEITVKSDKLVVESYNTGAVVPANTGVMVSSLTAGDHEVTLSEEAGESVLKGENLLRPTGDAGISADDMTTNAPDCKYYRLTMHNGITLGYFWGAAEGAAFDVVASKAYLAVPAVQAAKISGFMIDGGTPTGIESIENDNAAGGKRTIYNLQGQRVSENVAKGIYIVNGKKVIIK